ncbi:jg15069, partial [Pararge aegeria aegeria]
ISSGLNQSINHIDRCRQVHPDGLRTPTFCVCGHTTDAG